MATKIYSDVFLLFYSELFTKFQNLIHLEVFKQYPQDDYKQWGALRFKSDKSIFQNIFSPELTSSIYWYNKKSKAENSKLGYVEVSAPILIKALKFLKIKPPKNFQIKNNIDLKAGILFQLFLEKVEEGKQFLVKYPDLIIYDHESGRLIRELKLINKKNKEIDFSILSEELKNFTHSYFKLLNERDYYESWQMLTPRYKKGKFEMELRQYKILNEDIISINDCYLFDFQKTLRPELWDYGIKKPDFEINFKIYFRKTSIPLLSSVRNDYFKIYDFCDVEDEITDTEKYDLLKKLCKKFDFGDISRFNYEDLKDHFFDYYYTRYASIDWETPAGKGLEKGAIYFKVNQLFCIFSSGNWYIDDIKDIRVGYPFPLDYEE